MDSITVLKADLATKLAQNRDTHLAEYTAAVAARKEAVIDALARRKRDVVADKPYTLHFAFPEPENHVSDYETALAMLSWEQSDTIQLSQYDFERFVQNSWDWSGRVAMTNSAYAK